MTEVSAAFLGGSTAQCTGACTQHSSILQSADKNPDAAMTKRFRLDKPYSQYIAPPDLIDEFATSNGGGTFLSSGGASRDLRT